MNFQIINLDKLFPDTCLVLLLELILAFYIRWNININWDITDPFHFHPIIALISIYSLLDRVERTYNNIKQEGFHFLWHFFCSVISKSHKSAQRKVWNFVEVFDVISVILEKHSFSIYFFNYICNWKNILKKYNENYIYI